MDPSIDEDDMRIDGPIGEGGVVVGQGGLDTVVGGQGEGMDQERRIRREIANSNERRRMQSINAGFQSLRTLLPHHEGEKLSKAAILQQTAEYIYTLEQEKTLLLSQNSQLKRLLSLNQQRLEGGDGLDTSPQMKKKRYGTAVADSSDATVAASTTVNGMTDINNDAAVETGTVTDINLQLMQEQRLRLRLEERVKSLGRQLSMSSTSASGGGGAVVSTGNGTTITLPSKPEPPKNLTLLATTTTTAQPPQPDPRAEPHRAAASMRIHLPVSATTAGGTTILLQPPPPAQTPTAAAESVVKAALPAAVTTSTTVPASVLQAAVAASKKEVEEPRIAAAAASAPPHHVEVVERISSLQPQPPPAASTQQHQPVLPSMPLPLAAAVKVTDSSELVIRDPMDGVERSYTVTAAAGSNSRQNLDSIVEAIRHLEGDHLFSEDRQVVKEEVVDYSTTETIQVPNSGKAVAAPAQPAPAIASIQLPQEPVSISSAAISRSAAAAAAAGVSSTGGIIIIKQP